MFERFEPEARRILVLAQEQVRLLGDDYIAPEHILLGLASEGSAADLLVSRGLTVSRLREQLAATRSERARTKGSPPFTSDAKRVLEGSLREALATGRSSIGCVQVLISLLRLEASDAVGQIRDLGVSPADLLEDALRQQQSETAVGPSGVRGRGGMMSEGFGRPVPGIRQTMMRQMARPQEFCMLCGRDLWDVEHSVTNGMLSICDICVGDASRVILEASPESRSLTLPARVFGTIPDEEAVQQITTAAVKVFEGRSEEELGLYLEDADVLRPYVEQATSRAMAMQQGEIAATVRRVRFSTDLVAWIEVTIRLGEGGLQVGFEGPVHKVDGRWKVSRELMTKAVRRAGVEVSSDP